MNPKHRKPKTRVREFFAALGPGLITGAADDDPSGIATYSQVGAQFGFGLLWTMLFLFPFMSAVQEISARLGRVTGCGLSANIRRHYPLWLLYSLSALLFIANTINVGVDLGMMAASLKLLIDGPTLLFATGFALLSLLLEMFIPYKSYVYYLKWMALVLFAYVVAALSIHVPWKQVCRGTFWPREFNLNAESFTALLALLGTTISPYLFFWQASEEAEEVQDHQAQHALRRHPEEAPAQLRRIRIDTVIGMALSNGVAYFIILTTAAVLHAQGIRTIDTPAQAAEALKPLAGRFAFIRLRRGRGL
jgi:NRAMP (natural resistance-associated macrophage protein)-like metal ion transporter